MSKKNFIGKVSLFILGEVMVFGFIVLLQFVSLHEHLVGFIFTLIAMHLGIVSFILSKKLFKTDIKLTKYYIIEYIMLACFLPFLFIAIFKVSIDPNIKLWIVIDMTIVVTIISIINDYFFIKKININK